MISAVCVIDWLEEFLMFNLNRMHCTCIILRRVAIMLLRVHFWSDKPIESVFDIMTFEPLQNFWLVEKFSLKNLFSWFIIRHIYLIYLYQQLVIIYGSLSLYCINECNFWQLYWFHATHPILLGDFLCAQCLRIHSFTCFMGLCHSKFTIECQMLLAFGIGKRVLSDAWALDTAQKPYRWQKLNPEGDKPSARMWACNLFEFGFLNYMPYFYLTIMTLYLSLTALFGLSKIKCTFFVIVKVLATISRLC